MRLIRFVVVVLLLTSLADAQEAVRQWAGRAEYEMATEALAQKNPSAMIAGLLAWEAAYPNSAFAPERALSLLAGYQQSARATIGERPPAALLYKVVSLASTLKKRSPEQTKVLQQAANALLEELQKPGTVVPADARELAERALIGSK